MKTINFIILGLFVSLSAMTAEYDEELFVRKCFAQLTNSRISVDSEYLARAKQGESASDICMDILNRASFTDNGAIAIEERNSVGQKVLQNMHSLHTSFFSASDYELFSVNNTRATKSYMDSTQPAFYITKALFSDESYANAITSKQTLKAQRKDQDPAYLIWREYGYKDERCLVDQTKDDCGWYLPKVMNPNMPVNKRVSGTSKCSTDDSAQECDRFRSDYFVEPYAPRGPLYGFMDHPGVNVPYYNRQSQHGPESSRYISEHKDLNKNLGAGMIGDQVFIFATHLMNDEGVKANGAGIVSRTWAKTVYEDVLCRQMPALRNEDVEFQLTNTEGSSAFRWANTCLRCHVGMDQTAGYIRNLQFLLSMPQNNGNSSIIGSRLRPWEISSVKSWSETTDSTWYKQEPIGRLYYRDYNGKLVHKTGSGIESLAEQIAETDDYYICAAKNYYKHFMNVDVALPDPGKAGYVEDESGHRAELIRLGLEFKKHKSLKKLVESIFKSKFYYTGTGEE